jgi:hypothetical protein
MHASPLLIVPKSLSYDNRIRNTNSYNTQSIIQSKTICFDSDRKNVTYWTNEWKTKTKSS